MSALGKYNVAQGDKSVDMWISVGQYRGEQCFDFAEDAL